MCAEACGSPSCSKSDLTFLLAAKVVSQVLDTAMRQVSIFQRAVSPLKKCVQNRSAENQCGVFDTECATGSQESLGHVYSLFWKCSAGLKSKG